MPRILLPCLGRTMNVREHIVNKLIAAGGFWSYDEKSVRENMSDDQLIEAVLEKLDIDDILRVVLFRHPSAGPLSEGNEYEKGPASMPIL